MDAQMRVNDLAGASLCSQMQACWSVIILCDLLKPSFFPS